MKKQLEAELISLAHKILQLKNRADIHELKNVSKELYEKLSILSFVEKHFEGVQPTIGKKDIEAILEETEPDNARPDGTEHNTEEITEPNTEKIKDIVAQMPPESQQVDEVLEKIIQQKANQAREDFLGLGGIHYDDLPQFEKPTQQQTSNHTEKVKTSDSVKAEKQPSSIQIEETEEDDNERQLKQHEKFSGKSSLNDRLKKGIQIGLNDRLAYIKHLFDGNAEDYNRVISQLNTLSDASEAKEFIKNMVKPEYNHWQDKEDVEARFYEAIENKFE